METNEASVARATPHVACGVSATAYNHPLLQVQATEKPGCKCGKLRPPRKLHAAVGLWLALFVSLHFLICSVGMYPHSYEGIVNQLRHSLARLPGAVLLLILLPMLLQAGSGLFLLAKEGVQYDVKRCDRGGKLRYFLQRWSGLVMLAFLLPHVGSMRGWTPFQIFAATAGKDGSAFAQTAGAFHPWHSSVANSITILLFLVGTMGTVFHIANGAWSGAILWKIVQDDQGKARMGYFSFALGTALAAIACLAWYAFALSSNAHTTLATTVR